MFEQHMDHITEELRKDGYFLAHHKLDDNAHVL
jgi:hypothetical protein